MSPRQVKPWIEILPATSFRFHLAVDRIAARFAVSVNQEPQGTLHLQDAIQPPPLNGCCSRTTRHARRTTQKHLPSKRRQVSLFSPRTFSWKIDTLFGSPAVTKKVIRSFAPPGRPGFALIVRVLL